MMSSISSPDNYLVSADVKWVFYLNILHKFSYFHADSSPFSCLIFWIEQAKVHNPTKKTAKN